MKQLRGRCDAWMGLGLGCLSLVGPLACTPARVSGDEGDGTTEGTGSSSAASTDDGVDSSDDVATTVPADSSGSAGSSTGTGEPECGNGQVEPGEQCDEASDGCADCMFVCGLEPAIVMALTGSTVVTITPPPVAIRDGSGDFGVTSANAVHRITATGQQVWVKSGPPASDWAYGVALLGDDELVGTWTIGAQAPFVSRVTRHSPADGSIVAMFDVPGAPNSVAHGGVLVSDDDVLLALSVDTDAMTTGAVVQRRSSDGETVVWSTDIAADPKSVGNQRDYATFLGLADDGAVFMGGARIAGTSHDALVAKLDADGNELWQRVPFPDDATSIAARLMQPSPVADGGVAFVTWRQYTSAAISVGKFPALETRAVRLDADGETIWELDLSDQVESGRVQLLALRALDDGRFVVGGALVEGVEANAWFAYLDAEGTVLCSVTSPHSGGLDTTIADIFLDADGAMMVHGFGDSDDDVDLGTNVRWMTHAFPY